MPAPKRPALRLRNSPQPGRKAGITKDVHPHMLRHTYATELYRATKDIRLVQKALGHAQLSSTMIYTHIVDDDLETAMRALHL